MKPDFVGKQYNWACGAALVGLLVFAAGASWKHSFFFYALYDDQLVRLITPLLLITSLAWLTDFTVDRTSSGTRAVVWYLVNGALALPLLGWAALGFLDYYNHKYKNQPCVDMTASIFFGVIVTLFCIVAWVKRQGNPSTAQNDLATTNAAQATSHKDAGGENDLHSRWGRVASLIIMILALYAFGLRFESGKLKMHWEEVPAILVVFVLAELGVHLVVTSRRIDESVRRSAGLAMNAVADAQAIRKEAMGLSEAMLSSMGDLVQNGDRLVTRLNQGSSDYRTLFDTIAPIINNRCYESSAKLYEQLGMSKEEYWDKIGLFARSWDPSAQGQPGTKKLLNVLFTSYLGRKEDDGSVRQKDSSVSCVTADAVFADASEQWLEEMRKHCNQESPLVIWAVTSLMPTEFAFPSIWLGTDYVGEKASRVESLERFIYSVIGACKDRVGVQYRRVTVFKSPEEYEAYKKTRKVQDWLGPGVPAGCVKCEAEEGLMENSLENWMLWDPRVQMENEEESGSQVFRSTERLVRALLKADGKADAIDSERNLVWSNLKELFSAEVEKEFRASHESRMLPFFPATGAGKEVFLFQSEFADPTRSAVGVDGHTPHIGRADGAVLGGSCRFLNRVAALDDIKKLDVPLAMKVKLEGLIATGPRTTKALLEGLGWQSLKQWYCERLHTWNEMEWEAWWAVMKDKKDPYFDPLRLNWNGASFLTLDLLLIGSSKLPKKDIPVPNDGLNTEWHGAVISNLSFDRTECTVQLVTSRDRLRAISEVVMGLCEGKGGGDYGRWQEWPTNCASPKGASCDPD